MRRSPFAKNSVAISVAPMTFLPFRMSPVTNAPRTLPVPLRYCKTGVTVYRISDRPVVDKMQQAIKHCNTSTRARRAKGDLPPDSSHAVMASAHSAQPKVAYRVCRKDGSCQSRAAHCTALSTLDNWRSQARPTSPVRWPRTSIMVCV